MHSIQGVIKQFVSDKDGHVVIWQTPNLLLALWVVFKLLGLLLPVGRLRQGANHLDTAVLFAWAYLEAAKGLSYFRKALGILVLAFIIVSFFK